MRQKCISRLIIEQISVNFAWINLMTLTVSNVVKPLMYQYLGSLSHLVDIAEKHCSEHNVAPESLLNARLAEDMHPLIWQFQMVSEFAARCTSRLAEVDVPDIPFTETTFSQLRERIAKVVDYINEIDDEKLDSGLTRTQTVPLGPDKSLDFRGPIYLNHFFLPNFFFHITTAYNILRNNGVSLGKFDFVGSVPA